MGKRILYLISVIYTLYVTIMHENSAYLVLLFLELLVPLALFILCLIPALNVKTHIHIPVPVSEKNKAIPVYLEITNESILPIQKIRIHLELKNLLNKKKNRQNIYGMELAKGTTTFAIDLESSSCAVVLLSIHKIYFFDVFGLISFPMFPKESSILTILPHHYPTCAAISEHTREFTMDSDMFDPYRGGTDHTEIFQIREYQAQDRMQAVHWKLSARKDSLLVKEYSRPVGYSVVFYINHPEQYKEFSYDNLFEIFYSLSYALLEASVRFYAVWYDTVSLELRRKAVTCLEDLHFFISEMLISTPKHLDDSFSSLYQETFRGETFSTLLELSSDFILYKNGREDFIFQPDKIEEQLSSFKLYV